MCPKCVLSSPSESISVTYTRDRSAYVVDLLLAPVESTAFGRQGPEVQILSPRPFTSLLSAVLACLHASDALCLLPFGTNLAHGGIMATIRKRGNRYHVQVRRHGQSITRTFDRLATAKSWIPKIEGDIERHLYLESSGTEKITLLELFEPYQRQILPSHKGQQVETYRLGTLKKRLGSIRLIHLTPKEIASYRDIRLQEVSPASLKRELTILSRVLTIASRDWGISILQNPVKMISLPKVGKARTRRLEAGEKERLLQSSNPELHRIIRLALEAGMRRGEIPSIKKNHIDFNKSVLFIPSTKTDTPRTISYFQVRH